MGDPVYLHLNVNNLSFLPDFHKVNICNASTHTTCRKKPFLSVL